MLRSLFVVLLLVAPACADDEPGFPPKDASGKVHPVFLTVAKAPSFKAFPRSIWFGYPVSQVAKLEQEVEVLVNAERAKVGLKPLVALEELRFLGRVHAREWGALGGGGHESKLWGHVSDRGAVLFGWRPSEWVLSNSSGAHQICDNYMGGGSNAQSYVTGWMNSSGHKRAILWKGSDHFGMSIAHTKAHLMFAGLPRKTLKRVESLQPLYELLAKETKFKRIKKLIGKIVSAREGSSAMRIAPLLLDSDAKVRELALKALLALNKLVPHAKLTLFALVDLGLTSPDEELRKKVIAGLKKVTGQKHDEDVAAWRTWWHTDAHQRLR